MIRNDGFGQPAPPLLKIRNLHECWPKLNGGLDDADHVIDYPQQVRAFRLLETANGGVVLQTWMLNTDPSNRLANISRQLAYLDFQGGRAQGFAGARSDRNASLYVRAATIARAAR